MGNTGLRNVKVTEMTVAGLIFENKDRYGKYQNESILKRVANEDGNIIRISRKFSDELRKMMLWGYGFHNAGSILRE